MASLRSTERKQNRLDYWDYSSDGAYFVIPSPRDTKNREEFFGKIAKTQNPASPQKMVLNEYGEIAKKCWEEIPDHFENLSLDEFVIMPNHVHGIIVIDPPVSVGARHAWPLPGIKKPGSKKRNIQKLPTVIGSFKSSVTRKIRKNHDDHEFGWQRSYHACLPKPWHREDRIIRNENELNRIREYIQSNPENWENDRNNSKNFSQIRQTNLQSKKQK